MYKLLKLSFITSLVFISGCESLLESTTDVLLDISECAFRNEEGPIEISTLSLANGTTGINYSQPIISEIRNEPNDNQYVYEYTFTAEQLPPGLSYREAGRGLVIEGVPQSPGMYPLFIEVYSPTLEAQHADRNQSCATAVSRVSRNYILIID